MVIGGDLKNVIVSSTGGSVMNVLLENRFFRNQTFSLVSDRLCPAIDKAQAHGLETKVIAESKKERFCDGLLEYLEENRIDYVISFFTKLFTGDLLGEFKDRIINLHPSILPAFKGMRGFDDTFEYGARYMGSTIHFIDESMDEGKIIMQTAFPLDRNERKDTLRHRLFQQQCKSLLQVVKWLAEGRVSVVGNHVVIEGGIYVDYEFSPNLDFPDAISLRV